MSWAIWITGPPGSGKSTLARLAAERLAGAGTPVHVLELDRLRRVLTPHATYTDAERDIVYRALVFTAAALVATGQPVLIDATGHRREWRDFARRSIDCFAEVQLDCPLELCVTREGTRPCGFAPAHIYAAAGLPGATVPGVDVAYERTLAADLVIDTAVTDPGTAADRIAALGLTLGRSAAGRHVGGTGAVIWLTGPPGSGKTTLALRLTDGLATHGVPVTLLEWVTLRASVVGDACPSTAQVELAHRALACAAAELAAAGLVVVVDAAAPRRAWRELGRALVASFAEVQLICPTEVCAARERLVRWRPTAGPHTTCAQAPEWMPAYEYAATPDLVIDTAGRNEWTATEDLLILARRLLARARDLTRGTPITVERVVARADATS